jgi:predicted porin
MKKSLVALATLAVASGAMAQVVISGRANLGISTYAATGAAGGATLDYASRIRVQDDSSRITLNVTEDLGGGLRAGFSCDTGINVDNGSNTGQANTANTNSSEWCSRDGRLNFGNDTVELRLGRQNVFWTSGAADLTGANISGLMGSVSSNLYGGGVGLHGTRLDNMIKVVAGKNLGSFVGSELYWGINKDGYGESGNAYLAANATAGGTIVGGAGTGTYSGFKLQYAITPVWELMIDYQTAQNTTPSTTTSSFTNRTATKYQLGWKYGTGESIASVQYWAKERTDATAVFSLPTLTAMTTTGAATATTANNTGSGKDGGWVLNLNHDFGDGIIGLAQYGVATNMQVAATAGAALTERTDSGAVAYMLGGAKRFSKRTHGFFTVSSIVNGVNGNYNFTGGNGASSTIALGQAVNSTNIGLQHWF